MTRFNITGLALLSASLVWTAAVEAQTRTGAQARPSIIDQIRGGRNSDATPGAVADDVGAISGDERFLREARDANSFVGASREGGFVGSQTAVGEGEIRSAIEGDLVREAIDPAINRILSLPQLQTGMYAPRLRLGFTPTTLPVPAIESTTAQRLSVSSAIRAAAPLEVSLAGRTATLRGTVGSEHEKRLAGLMLLFEPGISKVENDLAVASPDSDSSSPESQPASAPTESAAPPPQQERSPGRS